MLDHLHQRAADVLASANTATLVTYGPADLQANSFPCEVLDLRLFLLVPRISDLLFNIESNPAVVVTSETWQMRGMARILVGEQRPTTLSLLHSTGAGWCEVVEVTPSRLQITQANEHGHQETIDFV